MLIVSNFPLLIIVHVHLFKPNFETKRKKEASKLLPSQGRESTTTSRGLYW